MICYLLIDVDGTLTDGGIYYDNAGNELKKFCSRDGTGILLAKSAGIKPIILTGRESYATARRMTDLGVDDYYQNISDKAGWIVSWIKQNNISKEEIAYIGDDLNDIRAMKFCGFIACPSDAIDEVKELADYVSQVKGGQGVVREVIGFVLKEQGKWKETIDKTYDVGK